MDSILQITQSQQEARVPVTVFELVGELDASNYEQFLNKAMEAVDTGSRCILLDLSQLKYISSTGLRAVYTLDMKLSEKGGISAGGSNASPGSIRSQYLKLFNPSPNVRNALDMIGLTKSMEIYSDIKDALASF
jgi:anti-anti-sigma factor